MLPTRNLLGPLTGNPEDLATFGTRPFPTHTDPKVVTLIQYSTGSTRTSFTKESCDNSVVLSGKKCTSQLADLHLSSSRTARGHHAGNRLRARCQATRRRPGGGSASAFCSLAEAAVQQLVRANVWYYVLGVAALAALAALIALVVYAP